MKKQKVIRKVLIFLMVAINIITLGWFLVNRGDYSYNIVDFDHRITNVEVQIADESIVKYSGYVRDGRYVSMMFHSLGKKGETDAKIIAVYKDKPVEINTHFEVNDFGVLIRRPLYDINQWHLVWLGLTIGMLLACIMLLQEFIIRIRNDLYSYRTMQVGGVFFFTLGLLLLFGILELVLLPKYQIYSAAECIGLINEIFTFFLLAASPFVIIFAIALSISNLMLIKKEGFRVVNLLGIGISVAVLVGMYVLVFVTFGRLGLPRMLLGVLNRSRYVLCGLFCFFLSFMLSTMVCGLVAAKRVPSFDKDYVIILGCGIRKDGTLLPLLQGRADRAIWFGRKQFEETGKQITYIPSGGQGSDEVISEGEAIRNYLLTQGIADEYIIPETKSRTTLENMKFSKAIIEERKPDAKVIYATTNYHVFRSGMLAKQAGLKAEGIGSKTRWYFWPNAFVREFVGMLYSSWKFELVFFGITAILLSAISIFLV